MTDRERAYALHRAGSLREAEAAYRQAMAAHPDDLDLAHYHAVLLMQAERRSEAIGAFEALLRRAPARADSAAALALCCRAEGRVPAGLDAAERATRLAPRDPLAWMLLGHLRLMAGSPPQAEAALRRAVAIEPNLLEAWHHLGVALQAQQRWDEAMQAYRRVLPAQPGEHYNLAICAEMLGDLEAARVHLEAACRVLPGRVDNLSRLAQVQAQLCDFEGEAASVSAIAARLSSSAPLAPDDHVEPFALTYLPLPAPARRTLLERYVRRIAATAAALPSLPPRPPAADPDKRPLRIGYLSPDFGEHAVGVLLRDVFAAHDRDAVSVHGYSLRAHAGETADAIRAGFDAFLDGEGMGTAEIAARIAADGVDVLIDLGGYTLGARPEVLALRPAPVQLAWLGFIDAHAAPWIDAVLLDGEVLPEADEAGFGDRVIRLPGTLFPGGRPFPPATAARADFGLPEGVPLLASFNNAYKLDAELLAAWTEIARRAPEAHFVVYLPEPARARFARAWEAGGGDPRRLLLVPKLPARDHAARAACCDLFLDAFRYQAGATAVAAVASGLPVLGRAGARPLARLGASLNRFLGLEELVCHDTAAYVARAVELASEPNRLAGLRQRLVAAADGRGLFDPSRTASAIEAACINAWRNPGCSGTSR